MYISLLYMIHDLNFLPKANLKLGVARIAPSAVQYKRLYVSPFQTFHSHYRIFYSPPH